MLFQAVQLSGCNCFFVIGRSGTLIRQLGMFEQSTLVYQAIFYVEICFGQAKIPIPKKIESALKSFAVTEFPDNMLNVEDVC